MAARNRKEMSTKKDLVSNVGHLKGKYEKPKLCFVNHCFNSSVRTPDKHFVYVKRGLKRQAWLAAGKVKAERSMKTNMYCCQDHFNLDEDFENDFHEAIRLGWQPRLKPEVLPHLNMNLKPPKFCNEEIRNRPMYPEREEREVPSQIDLPFPLPSMEMSDTPLRFPEYFPTCDYQSQDLNASEEREHRPKTKKQQSTNPLTTMLGNNALPVRQHFMSTSENVKVLPPNLQEANLVPQIPYVNISTMKRKLNCPPKRLKSNPRQITYSKFSDKKPNEPKMWDLSEEYKQKFLNKLDCYLETGIQLTPQYLQQSFKRFINENHELSIHKIKFYKINWFEKLLNEHKNIASKLESPNFTIEHTLNQLALVAHFSTVKFLYKHFFDNSSCSHPERIYVLDEYILKIPHYSSPCKIDVTRRDISESDSCGCKIVTLTVGANTFGHKVPPVLILQGGGLRPSFKKNFPRDWRIVTSPSGRLTPHYFQFWVEHFASSKPAGRMILLLNHEMRKYLVNPSPELLQVLENAEISVHFFHRSDKHELNPLGYDVFEKFEVLVQDHVEEISSRDVACTAISPDQLGQVLPPAWQALDPTTVSDSFKRAGLFPLNAAAFLLESEEDSGGGSEDSTTSPKMARAAVVRSYARRRGGAPATSDLPPLDCEIVEPPAEGVGGEINPTEKGADMKLLKLLTTLPEKCQGPGSDLPRFEEVFTEFPIKEEPLEAEFSSMLWNPNQASRIDLDLSTLDSQTTQLNFGNISTESLGFPISKTYFDSNKYQSDLIDEPEFQNALIPQVKLEVTENETVSLDNILRSSIHTS